MISAFGAATGKDFEVTPGPSDSTSCLSFSPVADYLAATSWDNQLRVWEVTANSSVPKAAVSHDLPALSCCWNKEGNKVFSGGADKQVKILDMMTGQNMGFVAHDAPVSQVKWMDGPSPALVTGSWDKTVKYWDLRSPSPMATVQMPDKVYAMDLVYPLLVVGTAERHVCILNLTNPTQIFKTLTSPLKWQTRSIGCFPNGQGFALGTIEGRVSLQYVDDKQAVNNFNYKCHRIDNVAYAINSIAFHPTYGTFATAGSDGIYNVWDKDSRQRLKSSISMGCPITSCTFNRNGSLFAYSVCYDWHKGHEHASSFTKNTINISAVQEADVKPKLSSTLKKR